MIHRPWRALDDLIPRMSQSILPRSAGLHMSELYGKLHPQKEPRPGVKVFTEFDLAMFAMGGFAVERILELGLRELLLDHCPDVERPAEIFSSEGVACSPDLYFYEPDDEIIIGDIKAKWMSTKGMPVEEEGENEFDSRLDKNFSQLKSYLHVLNENTNRSFNKARLICYFVNGDWKPPAPRLLGWDLEFTQHEIDENWDACMTIARNGVEDR